MNPFSKQVSFLAAECHDHESILGTLRDYQLDLVERIKAKWKPGCPVLATAATGAGKSRVIVSLLADGARDGYAVFIAHRTSLVEQMARTIWELTGESAGFLSGNLQANDSLPYQLATIQTLHRRSHTVGSILSKASVVIVDEAHVSLSRTAMEMIGRLTHAKVVGLTATPCRTDGRGLGNLYDEIIIGPQTPELIDRGFLSPYRMVISQSRVNTANVRTNSGGDFNESELSDEACKLRGEVFNEWSARAKDRLTIAFCVGIKHARQVRDEFLEKGIKAETFDSTIESSESRRILSDFAAGKIQVLCSVGRLVEGIDLPSISCILMIRPTVSVTIWLQSIGRGLRKAEGKEDCLVIDFTDNLVRLGSPSEYRLWSLDDADKMAGDKKKKETEEKEKDPAGVESAPVEVAEESMAEIIDDPSTEWISRLMKAEAQGQLKDKRKEVAKYLASNVANRRGVDVCAILLGVGQGWIETVRKQYSIRMD